MAIHQSVPAMLLMSGMLTLQTVPSLIVLLLTNPQALLSMLHVSVLKAMSGTIRT